MIKAILTDIEGTTTSLSFVKDVLFPYARQVLPDFVHKHAHEDTVRQLITDTCHEAGLADNIELAITQLTLWLDEDKKITPLKALQGLIWQAGYYQGDFKGHLYADAIDQLKVWKAQGLALYVYSSGSVLAQKLLFSHTDDGDLTPLFSGFFDTHIGGKKEVTSYQKIAGTIGIPADEILFLSDIEEELDAAKIAGLQTTWLVREQPIDTTLTHRQANNFYEIVC